MLLHELRHVDAHHRLLGVEQELGERLAELGLADARRSEEQERTVRPARIGEAGARAADGVRDDAHGLFLADDAPRQRVLHAQQLLLLALEHLRDRDAGPLRDDLGDLLVGDAVAHELGGRALGGLRFGDALLEFGDAPVLQLGHLREIAPAARGIELELHLLELVLHRSRALQRGLLGLPDLLEVGVFLLEAREGLLERGEALARRLVLLLLQRDLLDLELDDAPLELVERLGLGVDLHADARGGLVDEVDGLVRQESRGDVAVGQRGGLDERGVLDAHPMVHLEALLQAAEDGDGVRDAGRIDQDLLEATFERGILLHVLAEFLQRGGADAVQLPARQHGLEEVRGVHRAVGLAGPDEGVHLVDEEQDAALGGLHLAEHGLEALLEFAAILRAGDERAHVQGEQGLVAEAFRDIAVDDALGEAFDHGGLADAGLADEHGVVLGAAGKDADDAPDLLVAADDGVHLARAGAGREILAVLGEGLVGGLRIGRGHALGTAHGLERGEDRLTLEPDRGERRTERGRLGEGEQHVLGGHEVVLHRLGFVLGLEQERMGLGRKPGLARGLREFRQAGELAGDGGGEGGLVLARAAEKRGGHAAFLREQAVQEVRRFERRVATLHRLAQRLLEGFGGLFGQVAVRSGHAIGYAPSVPNRRRD